jgi:hypothetical protein
VESCIRCTEPTLACTDGASDTPRERPLNPQGEALACENGANDLNREFL